MSWVALPLTSTLGPVAAYNLLCVICPALGAWSARHYLFEFPCTHH